MEGIYTVNVDGSNEQQLTTSGNVPAWQSVDPAPASTQVSAPKPPSTGYGPASINMLAGLLPLALLLAAVGIGLIIIGFRKHRGSVAHEER